MIASTGFDLRSGSRDELLVEVRFVQRADDAAVLGDRDLREVVIAHHLHRVVDRPGASTANSSPETPSATRSRAVMPLTLEEALRAHPLVVVHLAEVARAVIVEDHHDDVVAGEVVAQLQQPGHRRARRSCRRRCPPRARCAAS